MFVSREDYPTIEAALEDYPGGDLIKEDLEYAGHPLSQEEQPALLYVAPALPYIVTLEDGWLLFFNHFDLFDFYTNRVQTERRLRANALRMKLSERIVSGDPEFVEYMAEMASMYDESRRGTEKAA
jgi:hypothetical protein